MKCLMFLSLTLTIALAHKVKNEVFHYRTIKFAWPCAEAEESAIKSGQYIPENNIIAGAARWRDKLFCVLPRWRNGSAVTLGYIPLSKTCEKSPRVIPYPNWESNTLPPVGCNTSNEHQLYSVTRCRVDEYNRLFVLDSRIIGILRNDRTVLATPALMIYDLETDCLIRRYEFKNSDSYSISTLVYMVLDSRSADDTYVYISDLDGMGLICYSFCSNDSWRIAHNFMFPDSLIPPYSLNNITFTWPAGIHSMFLSCDRENGYRKLYFHPIASTKLFQVSTEVIQHANYANSIDAYYKFKVVGDTGPNSYLLADAMDCDSGIVISSEILKLTVSCWNSALPFERCNLKPVLRDGNLLNAFDITKDDEGNFWITSCPPISYIFNRMDPNAINYRILKVNIKEAIKPCLCTC